MTVCRFCGAEVPDLDHHIRDCPDAPLWIRDVAAAHQEEVDSSEEAPEGVRPPEQGGPDR